MKRDMDLARQILLEVENCEEAIGGRGRLELAFDGYTRAQVIYHVELLQEAGLIEAERCGHLGERIFWPTRLTWNGHEFLDEARLPSRWERAKALVLEKGGALSFEMLKAVLTRLATESLLSK